MYHLCVVRIYYEHKRFAFLPSSGQGVREMYTPSGLNSQITTENYRAQLRLHSAFKQLASNNTDCSDMFNESEGSYSCKMF